MNRQDEIHAHALGVAMPCHDCREMDSLHRIEIERLRAGLGTCAELEEFLTIGADILADRVSHWKLMAFAGWLLAGIFAAADLIGSGR